MPNNDVLNKNLSLKQNLTYLSSEEKESSKVQQKCQHDIMTFVHIFIYLYLYLYFFSFIKVRTTGITRKDSEEEWSSLEQL